jgi:hypothetical protein
VEAVRVEQQAPAATALGSEQAQRRHHTRRAGRRARCDARRTRRAATAHAPRPARITCFPASSSPRISLKRGESHVLLKLHQLGALNDTHWSSHARARWTDEAARRGRSGAGELAREGTDLAESRSQALDRIPRSCSGAPFGGPGCLLCPAQSRDWEHAERTARARHKQQEERRCLARRTERRRGADVLWTRGKVARAHPAVRCLGLPGRGSGHGSSQAARARTPQASRAAPR